MIARVLVVLVAIASVGACQRERSARWYMAHADAMRAKVHECKADPKRAAADKDCGNAIEAFVTWARATGNAADAPAKPDASAKP